MTSAKPESRQPNQEKPRSLTGLLLCGVGRVDSIGVTADDEQPPEQKTSVGQYPYIVGYIDEAGKAQSEPADFGHPFRLQEVITLRSGEKVTVTKIVNHPDLSGRAGHVRAHMTTTGPRPSQP